MNKGTQFVRREGTMEWKYSVHFVPFLEVDIVPSQRSIRVGTLSHTQLCAKTRIIAFASPRFLKSSTQAPRVVSQHYYARGLSHSSRRLAPIPKSEQYVLSIPHNKRYIFAHCYQVFIFLEIQIRHSDLYFTSAKACLQV
jgi:hypothetical protein